MTKKEILINKITYRSEHRGTKEMDILLGNFVNSHIDLLNIKDLIDLPPPCKGSFFFLNMQ